MGNPATRTKRHLTIATLEVILLNSEGFTKCNQHVFVRFQRKPGGRHIRQVERNRIGDEVPRAAYRHQA